MNITIKATSIDLTPSLHDYVLKRVQNLEKYLNNSDEVHAHVEIEQTTQHHRSGNIFRAKINLKNGRRFFAQSKNEDILSAIDEVQDEMARELSSYKEKRQTLWKRGAQRFKDIVRGVGTYSTKWFRRD